MKEKLSNSDFFKVMAFMKKKSFLYIITLVLDNALVAVCYNVVLAFILKDVINAITLKDLSMLMNGFYLAIISFIIAFTFEPIVKRINNYAVRSTIGEMRIKAFNEMENLSVSEYEKNTSGDIITRLTRDVDTLEAIYNSYIPSLSFAVVFGIISIVSMLYVNLLLGTVALGLGFLSVLANYFISRGIKRYSEEYQEQCAQILQNIVDIKSGFVDIKMNGAEKFFFGKYNKINQLLKRAFVKREGLSSLLSGSNELFGNLNNVGVMVLGLYLSFKGYTTIGVVMSVIKLQGNACYLFQNVSSFLAGIQKTLPSARRILELFEMKKEDVVSSEEEIIINYSGDKAVSVNNIDFSYDGEKNIISDLSFEIKKGEYAGILGESGSGKSTLIKLLLGFYEASKGSITLMGSNIDDIGVYSARKLISYVSQDSHLFSSSIKENVRLGKLDASDYEIEEACKKAGAHDFIMNLSDGYDTLINEKADNISGGQRQRIALARALVSSADIMLIDEGTAALDKDTEKLVCDTLENLKGRKTIIMVSHKLSDLRAADKKICLT